MSQSTSQCVIVLVCLLGGIAVGQGMEMETKYKRSEMAPYFVNGTYYQSSPEWAYEKREYPSAMWIATEYAYGFNILFNYISGRNARGSKIAMTSPVLNKFSTSSDYLSSSEMAFYLPKSYQQNPPASSDRRAFLKSMPAMSVYVRKYGGWSTNSRTVLTEAQKLVRSLNYDRRIFRRDVFYTAGYDGPWDFRSRRNEIWLIAVEK